MSASQLRSSMESGNSILPPLPKTNTTWILQKLVNGPRFFGCNGTAPALGGAKVQSPYPFVVYLPNFDPTGVTNTSTGQIAYNNTQASDFLNTAYQFNSRINSTCISCAVMERTR